MGKNIIILVLSVYIMTFGIKFKDKSNLFAKSSKPSELHSLEQLKSPKVKYVLSSGNCWTQFDQPYYRNTIYFKPFNSMEDCKKYSGSKNVR